MKTFILTEAQMQAVMKAIKEISVMYVHAWDSVDGSLVMLPPSIERFENAHCDIQEVIKLLTGIPPSDDAPLVEALDEWKSARSGEKIDWTRLANAEHGLVKAHAKQKGGG